MLSKILIIDDEELFREDLAVLIRQKGYTCQTAPNANDGLKKVAEFLPDIILCDIMMPDRSGVDIIDDIHRIHPDSSMIMMTAFGTLETAIKAFRKGVIDYILKPFVIEDVLNKIHLITEHKRLILELNYFRRHIAEEIKSFTLIAQSEKMKYIIELINKVAPSKSTVLLTGESGTGKELVARAIHEMSNKKDKPFIAINCPSFHENLLESELFGHEKGAFTNAVNEKEGFFETAGNGTIFLDEISEIPIALQSKLLRVLEQREFYRVGGTKLLPMKARIIAATNQNLKTLIKQGKFREDLYYRIAVFEIGLPPLRERVSDMPALVEYFIRKFNKEMKRLCRGVTPDVISYLMAYNWPGNIRELRNIIERAMILCTDELITLNCISPQVEKVMPVEFLSKSLKTAVSEFEGAFIKHVLVGCDNNKEEAARRLKIDASTLYRKLDKLNIDTPNEFNG